ncbi:hypothetical protein Aab01nite_51970 [Paractinoplanes abujensis]|uniref:RNA polymerase sigma-B factor n=1 Tax=Paractinoplanes abujensis TaxID=882441 RepID=A0A7W7CS70_9ACTN|nr:SigB/SigF/SigG family RNA polymerase sigma factor [Actinoplanes abujensis]MBB4693736.1 RNA polymerase sigma-B factor [Actinoplanes abujensis]GID21607.1 hypothetical protein Aab01nite_51970 [Actinoplanes abujensis]
MLLENQHEPAGTIREDLDAAAAAYHARLIDGDGDAGAARDEFVDCCLPMAGRLARRYRGRGEPVDDLVQVARFALVKAVDRFDPERGSFTAYAVTTIQGELKKHFRDKTWGVHVTRQLRDTVLEVRQARAELAGRLSREPGTAEIAEHLGMEDTDVRAAMAAAAGYSPASLNSPVGDENAAELGDLLGSLDPDLAHVDDRLSVTRLLLRLPEREQRILAMRFYGNKSQAEIGAELGVSQMHVSRLLAAALAWLREAMLSDRVPPWRGADRHAYGVTMTVSVRGPALTVALTGELDRDEAHRTLVALHRAVWDAKCSTVTIDLDGVPFLDAVGVAMLADLARAAGLAGRTFAIARPHTVVRQVLTVSGLDKYVA